MRGGPSVLGIVLAGGEGKRLMPLTADRAKPAVPFGGTYRLVDFVLSNLVNADIMRICVLTQYKSHSLNRHITTTWRMSNLLGNYVTPVPAQQRLGPRWFLGSADAPSFGIITPASDGVRVERFLEKPADPPGLPDDPERVYASMGNYVFTTKVLLDALDRDADDDRSVHDMGGSILPMLTEAGQVQVYDFDQNHVPGETERDHGYWRDVGTLDAYYEAHTDLISIHPVFNLYNREWPIYTHTLQLPPAKFVAGASRASRWSRRAASSAGRSPSRCSRPASSSRKARWCRARSCMTTCASGVARSCGARCWTRTSSCRPAPRSASTGSVTRSCITSPRTESSRWGRDSGYSDRSPSRAGPLVRHAGRGSA